MLADLAAYHAAKVEAALSLALSREAERAGQQADVAAHLSEALRHCVAARDSWVALAERGKAAYHAPLQFNAGHGTARSGTWADRTSELDADVARLEVLVEAALGKDRTVPRGDELSSKRQIETTDVLRLEMQLPTRWHTGRDLPVEIVLSGQGTLPHGLMLCYRHTNQLEGPFERVEMVESGGCYRAVIPGAYLQPEWDLLVYVAAVLSEEQVLIHPGLYSTVSPLPYQIVAIDGS